MIETHFLQVSIAKQQMAYYQEGELIKTYLISTGANGAGEQNGSEQTPRGMHQIRAKIGADCSVNSVFMGRRPTGELYTPQLREEHPGRDWILTRILWLSGLESGKNRLGQVDTMRRYVYIHGTPDDVVLGQPGSKGCIRMNNKDICELFETIPAHTRILIEE